MPLCQTLTTQLFINLTFQQGGLSDGTTIIEFSKGKSKVTLGLGSSNSSLVSSSAPPFFLFRNDGLEQIFYQERSNTTLLHLSLLS
jgi:hypothetical protein